MRKMITCPHCGQDNSEDLPQSTHTVQMDIVQQDFIVASDLHDVYTCDHCGLHYKVGYVELLLVVKE